MGWTQGYWDNKDVIEKITHCRLVLQKWQKDEFGNISSRSLKAQNILAILDRSIPDGLLVTERKKI